MAIFNIFKKKKVKPKKAEPKEPIKKKKEARLRGQVEPPSIKPKPVVKTAVKPKKVSAIAYRVFKKPQVTEKATDLTKQNQYVFTVESRANKQDIKKTVEDIYGVEVLSVKVINIPPKKRRLGRTEGWRKKYRKAVVRIKEGQKIEVLPR